LVNYIDYDQYDLSEVDPYIIEGSECLINLLGITDTKTLNEVEANLSSLNMADLDATPVIPEYTPEHLNEIHLRLFREVYPFSGEFRQSEIGKGGHLFLPHKLIDSHLLRCMSDLHDERLLAGLDVKNFAERAGHYLNRINAIHPYREGNGRTQRILINQLALSQGFAFHWDAISASAMGAACREGRGQVMLLRYLGY
jgi:cell filamentation protein